MRRATLARGTHQHRDALGLAGASGPRGHEAVVHALGLVELDELEGPGRVVDEAGLQHLRIDGRLQRGVAGLVQGDAGEEVVDEAHEEGLILVHQLGDVHVAQHPHHDGALAVRGAGGLPAPSVHSTDRMLRRPES